MDYDYPLIPDEHDECIFVPHMEVQNVAFDWWHKDNNPGRFFGIFECDNSDCENEWGSAWTWLGRGQKCKKCTSGNDWHSIKYVNPRVVKPREKKPPPGPSLVIKPPTDHPYQNCEFCAELCGSATEMPTHHACKHVVPGNPLKRAYRRRRRRADSTSTENSD